MAYDYINFSCTLSTVYGTPGLYATLTNCENAVSDGSVRPALILNPLWSASKKATLPLSINKLGDGYQQTVFQGVDQISEEWSITSPVLAGTQVDDLLNQLRTLCTTSFLWSPNNGLIPYKEFTCDQWQKTKLGETTYQVATIFTFSGGSLPILPAPTYDCSKTYQVNIKLTYNVLPQFDLSGGIFIWYFSYTFTGIFQSFTPNLDPFDNFLPGYRRDGIAGTIAYKNCANETITLNPVVSAYAFENPDNFPLTGVGGRIMTFNNAEIISILEVM